MTAVRAFFIMFTLALIAAPAGADAANDRDSSHVQLLERAATSFDEGVRLLEEDPARAERSLRAAISAYESLLDAGVENGAIHYNIGNAHALLGDVGPAMLAYRRAEIFIPNDPNLRANIATLQSRIRTDIDAQPGSAMLSRVRSLLRAAPGAVVVGGALVSWSAFWLAMAARRRWPAPARAAAITAGLIFLCTAGVAAGAVWAERTDRRAVIVAPESTGRKGPDAQAYAPSFAAALPAGLDVVILDERPGWTLVRLADGRETWLPASDVERVRAS